MDSYWNQREQMVTNQIARRGLTNPRLLDAFRAVPRHEFVPPRLAGRAYEDGPLPIGNEQTISQPYIVALMTSLLALRGDETVLEIGTGSGYQAAVLSRLARMVHTIERFPDLAESAEKRLHALGFDNINVHTGDGSLGWPEFAPYAGILVTAAAPALPPPLGEQLAEGGKIVLPVGAPQEQMLEVWSKEQGILSSESMIPVAFVPLRGKEGWKEEAW